MQQTRRHGFILGLMAAAVLVSAAFTANRSQAQTTSNGPYYATPSWDQKLPASTRFVVLLDWDNMAVLDRETGLVWTKSASATTLAGQPDPNLYAWNDARHNCVDKFVSGRAGWRLPSVVELAGLLHPRISTPMLPVGHPFTDVETTDIFYWSATTTANDATAAWAVTFLVGRVRTYTKDRGGRVWCVRGSMNADAY